MLGSSLGGKMKITKFEDIEVWQLGRELTRKIYEITRKGEFAKDYGLKDQIRRASGSVMHNIAEGFDAGSNRGVPFFGIFSAVLHRGAK